MLNKLFAIILTAFPMLALAAVAVTPPAGGGTGVANLNANTLTLRGVTDIGGYTTTATAAGTTTLTVSSTEQQYFTGSTTQTVTLPVTSTLVLGRTFRIVNNSSGALTVNSSGANLVSTVAASTTAIVTVILTSGTTAASWSVATIGGSATTATNLAGGAANNVPYQSAASTTAFFTGLTFSGGALANVTAAGTGTFGGATPIVSSSSNAGSIYMRVTNTNNGVAAASGLYAENDVGNVALLRITSSGYTAAGIYSQAGATFVSDGAGGFNIAANHASGQILFFAGGSIERARINSTGLSVTGALTVSTTSNLSGAVTLGTLASDATHTDATVCRDTTSGTLFAGSGTIGICLGTSSARYKTNIASLGAGLSEIMKLRAVSYNLDRAHGDPEKTLYGFTAEQGGEVLPDLMGRDGSGQANTFDYMGVVPVLVKAIQELNAKIEGMTQ